MTNPVRNLPPITTLQHTPRNPTLLDSPRSEPLQADDRIPHQLHHSHSDTTEDLDTNPVHPNAKTISTTNAANGSTTSKTNISSPICRNCKTHTTPLWRRDETGQVLCNACGLFLKLHGRPRPISLKTDVIKSRNRVRHTPGSSGKSAASNPNTPELKAKSSEANGTSSKQKFSPKQYRPSKSNKNSPSLSAINDGKTSQSPSLVPLLPRGENGANNSQYHYQSWSNHLPQRQNPQQSYLKQHPSFAQPLHYPSSTPAQFAPNLAQITSPLLLAATGSTSKISALQSSSKRGKPNDKELAVSALENLSNDYGDKRISLVKQEDGVMNKPFSPSTALNSMNSPLVNGSSGTKLPALVAAAAANSQQEHSEQESTPGSASPSFGPQFSLSHHTPHQHSNLSNSSSIPTIRFDNQEGAKDSSQLPPLKPLLSEATTNNHHPSLLNPIAHYSYSSPQQSSVSERTQNSLPPIQQQLSQGSTEEEVINQASTTTLSTPPNSISKSNTEEVNTLRTRISELELVNDLYRTRIMELELMENAARQRENLLKSRLEELKMLPKVSINSTATVNNNEPDRKKPKHEY